LSRVRCRPACWAAALLLLVIVLLPAVKNKRESKNAFVGRRPERMALHNEIHARPPEALNAPLAISHTVMVCDAAERDASRAHVAALLREHHLPLPDAASTHVRMDLGPFRCAGSCTPSS
jgi:hypothetical protein